MNKSVHAVIEHLVSLHEGGQIESLAFAVVGTDGVPVFGHANPTYSLLGALEQGKLAMSAKMLRDATDARGFEEEPTH